MNVFHPRNTLVPTDTAYLFLGFIFISRLPSMAGGMCMSCRMWQIAVQFAIDICSLWLHYSQALATYVPSPSQSPHPSSTLSPYSLVYICTQTRSVCELVLFYTHKVLAGTLDNGKPGKYRGTAPRPDLVPFVTSYRGGYTAGERCGPTG